MLYLENGYIDIPWLYSLGAIFNFIVGGRGAGKTYGALQFAYLSGINFILLRRTQSQLDVINKPEFSPFKTIARDLGKDITSKPLSKYHAGFYNCTKDGDALIPSGLPFGYSMALSTISNMRGFDASDVDLIIYDEFIPEKHERPIKEEGAAFLNAYETINRNRELQGRPPVRVLCLANANDLGNPIFTELKLTSKAEQMYRRGQEFSISKDKLIGLFVLRGSPISDQKKKTALYQITQGSSFSAMALDNQFDNLRSEHIKPQPLAEYKPLARIGQCNIYRHKSKRCFYVCKHESGTPLIFGTSQTETTRFWRTFPKLYDAYIQNLVYFEDATTEVLFLKTLE